MTVILPITKYVHLNSLSSKQLCRKEKCLVEKTGAQRVYVMAQRQ